MKKVVLAVAVAVALVAGFSVNVSHEALAHNAEPVGDVIANS